MKKKYMKSKWAFLSKKKLTHAKLKLERTKLLIIIIRRNYSAKGHNYPKTIIQNPGTTIRAR